jgi:hypothetical protein
MARMPFSEEDSFFNLSQAKWVISILGLLIAVVGRESLVGLILRQTRSEIQSIVEHEEEPARAASYENN